MRIVGNQRIFHFVHDVAWEVLPTAVQRTARMAPLDTLGAVLVGTLTQVSRITAEYGLDTWSGDEATILLHGRRASVVGAALGSRLHG